MAMNIDNETKSGFWEALGFCTRLKAFTVGYEDDMDETTRRQTVGALGTVGRVGTHAEHAVYILCWFG